jgi:hypothetical protein
MTFKAEDPPFGQFLRRGRRIRVSDDPPPILQRPPIQRSLTEAVGVPDPRVHRR